MQRERTFFRGRKWLMSAVSCLFVMGLAACGGGGGTPGMTITATTPFERAIGAATPVTSGETVTGTLESADDVEYYRLEVAETSTIDLTIDAEAGLEIALLDSYGAVLATAVTASEATVEATVQKGTYYGRVKDAVRRAAGRVNKAFSVAARTEAALNNAGSIINLVKGIPDVDLTLRGVGRFVYDLSDHIRVPDPGGEPNFKTSKIGAGRAGVLVTVEETTLTVLPNPNPGPGFRLGPGPLGVVRVTVSVTVPGFPVLPISFSVRFGAEGLRVSPEFTGVGQVARVFTLPAGEGRDTEPLENFFSYQAEARTSILFKNLLRGWRYTAAIQRDWPGTTSATGWTAEIVGAARPVLRVRAPSSAMPGDSIVVAVTVKDWFEETATARFAFSVDEEPEEPTPPQPPTTPTGSRLFACLDNNGFLCNETVIPAGTPPDFQPRCDRLETLRSQCPRTAPRGTGIALSCRYSNGNAAFTYPPPPYPVDLERRTCQGRFTVHQNNQ